MAAQLPALPAFVERPESNVYIIFLRNNVSSAEVRSPCLAATSFPHSNLTLPSAPTQILSHMERIFADHGLEVDRSRSRPSEGLLVAECQVRL
jgi:hypothetical protein